MGSIPAPGTNCERITRISPDGGRSRPAPIAVTYPFLSCRLVHASDLAHRGAEVGFVDDVVAVEQERVLWPVKARRATRSRSLRTIRVLIATSCLRGAAPLRRNRRQAECGYRLFAGEGQPPRLTLGRDESELLHHTHLIPLLPAFDNLPGSNAVQN